MQLPAVLKYCHGGSDGDDFAGQAESYRRTCRRRLRDDIANTPGSGGHTQLCAFGRAHKTVGGHFCAWEPLLERLSRPWWRVD